MEWVYDVLRFYNEIWTINEAWGGCERRMEDKLMEFIEHPDTKYLTAHDYITRKCKYILSMMWTGKKEDDIVEYIATMRKEWGEIVLSYNNAKRCNNA